ncbi:MAG: amidophosphoribosyltransferase [Thermobacillus sp. ZCTH02-B1]|uniref:amidophosphoribosyltransferase n=1 Tax=Thermobacillus sp. ZCTH02-B1 TaxID=1858795 RepID=UPI000B557B76|nr:amidophosphoribosyltransferase [Thermobacillus sp. ZCTH02-B1]OUM94400.1 MAG: amidophosphoribosyltransferase [Thermobacillus sp. ZCTH02-B1]
MSAEELSELVRSWTEDGYYNEGAGREDLFDKVREECGVFGVFGIPDAAALTYYGLHALQHRGEESCGICTVDSARPYESFAAHRGMGLVKEVFTKEALDGLRGDRAIGHVRYSTSGASSPENAQPLVFKYRDGDLAVATNGNLVNAPEIRAELEAAGSIFQTTSDTEVIAHLIARSPLDFVGAVKAALQRVVGGFAFLIMTNTRLIAASDPNGLRPLCMGRLSGGYVFASETCALEAVGAEFVRDIFPGEMLILGEGKDIRVERFAPLKRRALCAMEYIYFARPDSDVAGINLHAARKRMGSRLAIESFVDADVVTGVPDSSISAAIGYAEQTGIPYELGLIKNKYTGRTFIQPSQELRERGVKMKLSAVRRVVEGKRVVMIDDSIVRGTTSRRIVNLLREAGAREVHVRITSPPFANPCFYGIDTPDRKDLIAAQMSVEEIRKAINADSLVFLSKEGFIEAVLGLPAGALGAGVPVGAGVGAGAAAGGYAASGSSAGSAAAGSGRFAAGGPSAGTGARGAGVYGAGASGAGFRLDPAMLKGLREAGLTPEEFEAALAINGGLCMACFDNDYPTRIDFAKPSRTCSC